MRNLMPGTHNLSKFPPPCRNLASDINAVDFQTMFSTFVWQWASGHPEKGWDGRILWQHPSKLFFSFLPTLSSASHLLLSSPSFFFISRYIYSGELLLLLPFLISRSADGELNHAKTLEICWVISLESDDPWQETPLGGQHLPPWVLMRVT